MPASEILVHDASDGRVRRLADDASLQVAGPGSELGGAARVERQPIPPFELRDVELRSHLLVVMLSPPGMDGDRRRPARQVLAPCVPAS